MKSTLEILITGDICIPSIKHSTDITTNIWTDTLPLFKKSDIIIGNLEFPLINNCNAITKTGPAFHGADSLIDFFINSNFTLLGLANNHIKDCGEEGVLNTINICHKNNIQTVGAGLNEKLSKKPLIIKKNGWKVGVMAFAEHEFNAACDNEAGANLFDVYEDFDRIKELKKQVDYLIILNHGGIEYYEYPSPLLQKKCRKMIDSGADYVINQHSHLIGTEEKYKHGNILYGQGNTLFGYRPNQPSWNQGLLIKITLRKTNIKTSNIPIIYTKENYIRLQNDDEKRNTFMLLKNREKRIQRPGFINENWNIYCKNKSSHILPHLLGLGRVINKLNRITKNKIIQILYSKKQMLIIHNLIRCESHNEVVKTILKNITKK